jgi:hypothetical protein
MYFGLLQQDRSDRDGNANHKARQDRFEMIDQNGPPAARLFAVRPVLTAAADLRAAASR